MGVSVMCAGPTKVCFVFFRRFWKIANASDNTTPPQYEINQAGVKSAQHKVQIEATLPKVQEEVAGRSTKKCKPDDRRRSVTYSLPTCPTT